MSEIPQNTYPIQYIKPITLKDGTIVQLRPIHKDDGAKYEDLAKYISDESMYNRFLGVVKLTDKQIEKFTQLDYSKEMAIVAEVLSNDQKQIIGIARLAADEYNTAEMAITIIDNWHGQGLGKLLTHYILKIGKELGYKTITARVFESNKAMIKILDQAEFVLKQEDKNVLFGRLDFEDEFQFFALNW